MRVGLFTNNYLPFRGGVTTAVETLREGLDALGHRAWVFAPAPARALPEPAFVFRYPSVPAPTYPGFALPLPLSPRLARTARQLQLEIFHAQHPFLLGPAARRLARAEGRPIVFTYHTRYEKYAHYVPLPERLVAALAVRLSCRFADATDLVVAPSGHIAHVLASRGVRAPVVVVPTGVDLDRFRPGAREAARRGLGLAAAHACGLPAVAVRASGVDEVIRDGETGLLTKAEAAELADAAIGLLLDRSRRENMARAARGCAEAEFSAVRQVAVMAGQYRALLERRR